VSGAVPVRVEADTARCSLPLAGAQEILGADVVQERWIGTKLAEQGAGRLKLVQDVEDPRPRSHGSRAPPALFTKTPVQPPV
jgi:hypothetical protein